MDIRGTCETTVVAACAGANADESTCTAAGSCTFTPSSGNAAATCTTTPVAECASANDADAAGREQQCASAGACTYTDDFTVVWRGGTMTQENCAVSWTAPWGSCRGTVSGNTLTWTTPCDAPGGADETLADGNLNGNDISWSNGIDWERTDPCTAPLTIFGSGEVRLPQQTSNFQSCRWDLSCTDPGFVPELVFSHFDTEDSYDFVRIDHTHICETTVVAACAGANAQFEYACNAVGSCTFTPSSGNAAATCTTAPVAECASANADAATCESAGACTYTAEDPAATLSGDKTLSLPDDWEARGNAAAVSFESDEYVLSEGFTAEMRCVCSPLEEASVNANCAADVACSELMSGPTTGTPHLYITGIMGNDLAAAWFGCSSRYIIGEYTGYTGVCIDTALACVEDAVCSGLIDSESMHTQSEGISHDLVGSMGNPLAAAYLTCDLLGDTCAAQKWACFEDEACVAIANTLPHPLTQADINDSGMCVNRPMASPAPRFTPQVAAHLLRAVGART
jgi:hypothetical protein